MKIKVITKLGTLLEEENLEKLTLDSINGKIQILPGHENFITTVNLGKMQLDLPGIKRNVILAEGSIVKIEKDNILVLANESHLIEGLVKQEVDAAIKRAEAKMSSSDITATELIQLEKTLRYERFKMGFIEG